MVAAGVPTAAYAVVSDPDQGMAEVTGYPVVIKADGLAAGKGVIIAGDEREARAALHELLVEHRFATERVIVEEHLSGEELSLLALCDGETAVPLASAQDYKRIFDGDEGPNTGGMGSYSPVAVVDDARAREICAQVHQPVLGGAGPARPPLPRRPVRRADDDRRRDPRAGVQRPLRRPRDAGHPAAAAHRPADAAAGVGHARRPGRAAALEWAPQTAVTVVLASAGYPESSRDGDVITGLDEVGPEVFVTHAGTAFSGPDGAGGEIVTHGGRVLSVTGLGDDAAAARAAAYAAADMIAFAGKQVRHDIALRAVR